MWSQEKVSSHLSTVTSHEVQQLQRFGNPAQLCKGNWPGYGLFLDGGFAALEPLGMHVRLVGELLPPTSFEEHWLRL